MSKHPDHIDMSLLLPGVALTPHGAYAGDWPNKYGMPLTIGKAYRLVRRHDGSFWLADDSNHYRQMLRPSARRWEIHESCLPDSTS